MPISLPDAAACILLGGYYLGALLLVASGRVGFMLLGAAMVIVAVCR